ncbi:MAG: glutamine-hydrolyzing GMP synthase, partial [Rhodococcus sp. (in: high G+C Gram-positive bacteria)]
MTATPQPDPAQPRPVLVVDFGAQYAQLIARRVREAHVYSEVISHTATVEEIAAKNPIALVLSGGPSSVYAEDAPALDAKVFDLDVPVFGICYGFQAMAQALGGTVSHTGTREYGRTQLSVDGGVLHDGLPATQPVWMSHGDAVTEAPDGFTVTATSAGAPVAAFENTERRLAGVQYHPEVMHSPHGQQVLRRFLYETAGIKPEWTAANIADALVERVQEQVGDSGRAICGLSGGVDSAVAAALVQRAIGDRLTCVFVDHGLLREGEREQVQQDFVAATGAKLVTVDAVDTFLGALEGVSDPEEKRKIIGREFIRSFEGAVSEVLGENAEQGSGVDFLVQGTLYPDVVESGGGSGT